MQCARHDHTHRNPCYKPGQRLTNMKGFKEIYPLDRFFLGLLLVLWFGSGHRKIFIAALKTVINSKSLPIA